MSGVVTPILQWLNENPELAGLATFVISAAESVAIIGTIVPGSVTMTAIGALAGAGVIPLWSTIIWAILGAIVGDGISYWIGHYFQDRLRRMWPFKDNPGILEKGEVFVHKYGVASIFIGRFVGPVRALVPVVAGMLGMKPLQFTVANVTSAIGWAPAYMLPGILLGAASLELPPDIALHVMLGFFLILLFFTLCTWLFVKILQLVHIQIDNMQNSLWGFMKASSVFSPITRLLKHHDRQRKHGQLNLAFYLIIFASLFLVLAFYVKIYGAGSFTINEATYHFFRGIRNATLDNIMLAITLLGQKQILYPVFFIIIATLLYAKHYRAAAHAFMLSVFTVGAVFVVKNLLKSQRPWGIAESIETYSMPSGHSTLAITLYFGLAFLAASTIKSKRGRWILYSAAGMLTLAIGISRLYLNAHWFTDVFSAWLLGAAIICFVIISYERDEIDRVKPMSLLLPTLLTLMLSYTYYYHKHFDNLLASYTQLDKPTVTIRMQDWWSNDNEIPDYRSNLFGFPSQPINIQWVGKLDDIQKTLMATGWVQPPARDWVSTIHRMADISSTQYLPMISPKYEDKSPALILTRNITGYKSMLVLRIWNSTRVMATSNETLWVGIIGIVPRTYSWVFKRKNGVNLDIQPSLIFSTPHQSKWSYKIVTVDHTDSKVSRHQRVILIRPR